MQDVLGALAGLKAGFDVADVSFHETEPLPLLRGDQFSYHVQIAPTPGEEVLAAHDALPV